MAFVNEYVPPIELETSEFLRAARAKLRVGHSKWDKWTVDRLNEMALRRQGGGSSPESSQSEYWSFIDRKGYYYFSTRKLATTEISPQEIAITRSIGVQTGEHFDVPDAESLAYIKEALCEHKDYGVISHYTRARLTLIDAFSGKEV